MHPYYDYGWQVGGVIMMIMMILFWIALLVGAFLVIRYLLQQIRPLGTTQGGDSAMQILRERYARGEISREEFEERRSELL